ncbi:MAG: CYTH domain-containing protein [Myxococcota bacterium]
MIREIELKYRFEDLSAFQKMLSSLPAPTRIEKQTNNFFDTQSLSLKAEHIFLRLRQSNEDFYFTCKAKPENMAKPSDTLSIHDEWEEKLADADAQALFTGQEHPLNLLKRSWPNESESSKQTRQSLLNRINNLNLTQPIAWVGSFKNTRTHVAFNILNQPLDLEFDATDFGSRIDYEVECELPATMDPTHAESELQALFEQAGVQAGASSGKAERFFKLNRS